MANRWNIPEWLEQEVRQRDRSCIYCGVSFNSGVEDRKNQPTWEHIVNDARIITVENIALCCFSCNASKGAKELSAWLESKYCKSKGITRDSVSKVVKQALENPPELNEKMTEPVYCVRESYGISTNLQLYSLRQAWRCWGELKQEKDNLTEEKCRERYVLVIDLLGLSLSQLLGQNVQHSSSRVAPPKQLLSRFLNGTNYSENTKNNLIERFAEFVNVYDDCRHFGLPKYETINSLNYHKTEQFVDLALEIWDRVINHFDPVPENDEAFRIIKDILNQHLEAS